MGRGGREWEGVGGSGEGVGGSGGHYIDVIIMKLCYHGNLVLL